MESVIWLASGIVAAAALLVAGYVAGRATLTDDVRRLEERTAGLLEQIEEALAQGDAGAEAARIVVATERRASAARRAGTPRERRRLLREPDDPPSDPPGGGA